MSKGSGGTRASSSGIPANRLSRYDGEEIADGKQKVSASTLRSMSDTELNHAERNVRESLSVRGAYISGVNTPDVKRLKDAEGKISKEIYRRGKKR